ncbi:MAG: FHA domain-containing protein, partial [Myxococcales bacterium]
MLEPLQTIRRRPPPDLLAERTRPDGPSARITAVGPAAAATPRLVVTAGPRKGAEFALPEPLTTVGRGAGNGVAIADPSVSRRHARVEKRGPRWLVCDQGSGNGTRVNGRRVDRQQLRHGDEIALGDTRLRFLEPEGVIAWSGMSSSAAWQGKAHLYGAAVLALAIVAAAGVVRQRRLRDSLEAQARAEALRAAARARFQESVALATLGKKLEARDKLRVAAELDPHDPEIARSLQSAEASSVSSEGARPRMTADAAFASAAPPPTRPT